MPNEGFVDQEHKWDGQFRAKCVENDINGNKYGAIRVFIPDMMTPYDPDNDEEVTGLIAYPANNSAYGAVAVPRVGDYVWVIFEGGDPSSPFYTSVINIKDKEVPAECKNVQFPHQVRPIFKTPTGRSMIVADSPDVQRIEITGKRRKYTPASGDPNNYKNRANEDWTDQDGNYTTILLDEREGKEKILLRSHKGDFIIFDIEQRSLQVQMQGDLVLKVGGKIQIEAGADIGISSGGNTAITAGGALGLSAAGALTGTGGGGSHLSGGIHLDGRLTHTTEPAGHHTHVHEVRGYSNTSSASSISLPRANPQGTRDT